VGWCSFNGLNFALLQKEVEKLLRAEDKKILSEQTGGQPVVPLKSTHCLMRCLNALRGAGFPDGA